jgi:hypothetical protein
MKIYMKNISAFFILFIILFWSCKKNEQSNLVVKMESINGLWVLEAASRNGLETNTLQGLFYDINDSSIISNITGDTLTASYVLKEGSILHMMRDTIMYDIISLDDSTLEINSVIRDMPFQFKFKRQTDTIQDTL